jgi:hypothetical protein
VIESLLGVIEQNAGVLTLIFSSIVAISTAVYAILTWRLVTETKEMRKAQTEPKVSIHMQPDESTRGIFYLIIENIGMGPAYNITFKLDNDIERAPGYFLSKNGFFEKGISFLPPHQRYSILFTTWLVDYENKINSEANIEVKYRDCSGFEYSDHYSIDLSLFKDLIRSANSSQDAIAKSLENIHQDIANIMRGWDKLHVQCHQEIENKGS